MPLTDINNEQFLQSILWMWSSMSAKMVYREVCGGFCGSTCMLV